jgi:hypothetical protein
MAPVHARTGEELSALWLVLLVPTFLVGLFFYAVSALTCMAVLTAILDVLPAPSLYPGSTEGDPASSRACWSSIGGWSASSASRIRGW